MLGKINFFSLGNFVLRATDVLLDPIPEEDGGGEDVGVLAGLDAFALAGQKAVKAPNAVVAGAHQWSAVVGLKRNFFYKVLCSRVLLFILLFLLAKFFDSFCPLI